MCPGGPGACDCTRPAQGRLTARGSEAVDPPTDARVATAAHAQLIPRDVASELEERRQVGQLGIAGGLVLQLDDRDHEGGQVRLEPRIHRTNRNAELLQHQLTIGQTHHGREATVVEGLLDLTSLLCQGGSDDDAITSEHLVDGVDDLLRSIADRTGVRSGHQTGRHRLAPTHDQHGQDLRVHGSRKPLLLPALQLGVEATDRRPEELVDALDELVLAPLGGVLPVHTGNRGEHLRVVHPSDLVTKGVVLGGERLFGDAGERLHLSHDLLGDVEESDTSRQRCARGGRVGRLVHLEDAGCLERVEPGLIVRGLGKHVDGSRAERRRLDRRRHRGELGSQLAGLHGLDADTEVVLDGQHTEIVDGRHTEIILDRDDDIGVDTELGELGGDLVGDDGVRGCRRTGRGRVVHSRIGCVRRG